MFSFLCNISHAKSTKLFCDSRNHCKIVLKDARSNYAETIRCSVASHLIRSPDFWRICNSVLNRGSSQNIITKIDSRALYDLDASKATGPTEFPPLSLRYFLQCFLLFFLSYTINAWPNLVFLLVEYLHRLCQFLKMIERDLIHVRLNILTSLAFSLTFSMVFVLPGPLLTSWLFSVSLFRIRWMQVERRGLLPVISEGVDCSTS